jgi:hypothetical protein
MIYYNIIYISVSQIQNEHLGIVWCQVPVPGKTLFFMIQIQSLK